MKDHRLKDDEPLQLPQYSPHPTYIFHQGHHKASPDLPTWRVIELVGHDRKGTPPPLPSLVVCNVSLKVSARVGANLLESEVP